MQGMPSLPGALGPLRRHGDEVEALPGGFFAAHGRCDDTMNLGGIKESLSRLLGMLPTHAQEDFPCLCSAFDAELCAIASLHSAFAAQLGAAVLLH